MDSSFKHRIPKGHKEKNIAKNKNKNNQYREMVGYTIEKEHIERRYKSPKSRQSGVMCRDVISRERDPKKKQKWS